MNTPDPTDDPMWEWTRDVSVIVRDARVWEDGVWTVKDVRDMAFLSLEEDAEGGVVLLTQLGCDVPIPFDAFAEMCRSFLTWYTLRRSGPVQLISEPWRDGPQDWGADSFFAGKTVADLCWWAYWDSGSTRYQVASMLLANDTLPPTIHHQARKIIRGAATPPLGAEHCRGGQMTAPYYEDDHVTIYHGDCREVTEWLTADVLVTDPPYGMAYESNRRGKRGETAASAGRARSIAGDDDTSVRDEVLRVWGCRPALVFGTWKRPRPTATKHVLTWLKGDHLGMGDLSVPWRPNTEEVYVLGSGFSGHRGTSVLDYPGPVSWATKGRMHQHQKPVELMHDLLSKCPPGVIADPFMGSGSTLRAAKDLGRKAIGIELDERYCEIAANRMGQEVLDFGGVA